MLYCYHCGYQLDEQKAEEKSSTLAKYKEVADTETEIQYVCPRCGHIVRRGHTEEDIKSLSRASHAELQRGRNDFARGMCMLVISVITLVTSLLFLVLSRKITDGSGYQISFTTPEFFVFAILAVVSIVLIVYGSVLVVRGLKTNKTYHSLLRDINNETFVQ